MPKNPFTTLVRGPNRGPRGSQHALESASTSSNTSFARHAVPTGSPLHRTSPLDGISTVTRLADAGVVITDRRGLAIYQLVAPHRRIVTAANAINLATTPGRLSSNEDFTALPLAKGRWLLIATSVGANGFVEKIARQTKGMAYLVDQSHAFVVLRVTGAKIRNMMMKGCRLNLTSEMFAPGTCAQTLIAEISTILYQVDNAPTYELIIPSGYADSFWHWVDASSAEFGYYYRLG